MATNILLVDDDPLVREAIRKVLELRGIRATAVCGVKSAKDMLKRYSFSAVVSDVEMDDGTGIDLHAWAVNEVPHLRNKFIFCSGGLSPDLEEYIERSGCRFFEKPIYWDGLIEAINEVRSSSSSRATAGDGAST